MTVEVSKVFGQVYIIPTIKVTYTRYLNGEYELILGWLKWYMVIRTSSGV